MKQQTDKIARRRSARSLNLILWATFAVFALILIALFVAFLNILFSHHYREQIIINLKQASKEALLFFEEHEETGDPFPPEYFALETKYDVNVRSIYAEGGGVIFAATDETGEVYPELAEMLTNFFAPGRKEALIEGDDELAYAVPFTLHGKPCFLYVWSAVARFAALSSELLWGSLATALFSVVLAFVASGFFAMLITKPVSEVTERAKEIARGHYEYDFKQKYFFSELTELSDALDYARSEISKADAMQKELIANVSHDFRTPLTMIKAYASMIREISGDDPVKRNAHAKVIEEEADRLASLVEDVLDLSKIRAGVGGQAPVIFNLTELVYKIAGKFDYLKEMQGYVFETEIEDEIYAFADRGGIEQALYNLISNAVNYTGEDKTVRIRLLHKGEGAIFEVVDSGKGIPPEQIDTIWDRYFRMQETHKRPVKGTGLGLSIVKGILVNQHCPFGVQSEVGKGSRFWVEFPKPPEDPEVPEIPEGPEGEETSKDES